VDRRADNAGINQLQIAARNVDNAKAQNAGAWINSQNSHICSIE
jgi:hypothetical protein